MKWGIIMDNSTTIRIALNQLHIGMVSAENLYNSSGLLLVPKDVSINQTHLFRMKLYHILNLLVYTTTNPMLTDPFSTTFPDTKFKHIHFESKEFLLHYQSALSSIKYQIHTMLSTKTDTSSELYLVCLKLLASLKKKEQLFHFLYQLRSNEESVFAHCLNVALINYIFGTWLKFDEQTLKELTLAGLLHDIGKTQIPNELLNKQGELTEQEFDIIYSHPLYGFKLIQSLPLPYGVSLSILQHHEKLNGTGYPYGFQREQIHDYAKITAISDIYDAMTSDRTYHKRFDPFKVLDMFEKEALDLFDNRYLYCFLEHVARLYVGRTVLLNTNESGKIVLINQDAPSRPLVQVGHKIYNLEFELSIHIEEVI